MKRTIRPLLKRLAAAAGGALVLAGSLAVPGSAAGIPSYTAKYGAPTIDGVVNDAEYGPAQPFNKDNLGIFFGQVDLDDPNLQIHYPDLTYRFAWTEDALFVGITAAEVESLTTCDFQIDVSPEKKVRDRQKGMFFTFKILSLDNGMMSVIRNNYQTGGSTVTSMNITSKVEAKATKTAKGAQLECKIPLKELQTTGQGRDFSKVTLKSGTWGVAAYFVGNGLGFTSSQGKCHYTTVTENKDGGGLIEYYNDLVLAAKSSTPDPVTTTKAGTATTARGNAGGSTTAKSGNSGTTGSTASGQTGGTTTAATGDAPEGTDGTDADTPAATDESGATIGVPDGSTTEPTTDSGGKSGGLHPGVIVGIVAGGLVLIGGGVLVVLKVKKIL